MNKKNIKYGYNSYLKENDNFKMLMDIGILKLKKNIKYSFKSNTKEKAILIWSGKVKLIIESKKEEVVLKRKNIWEEFLMAFHTSKDTQVIIEALEDSELLLQAKTNDKSFKYKLYDKSNCSIGISGINYSPSVSTRYVVDVFNYDNAPYSNMVLGEVFTKSGHWSGYPPHNHDQSEVYVFRFNKEQGFGVAITGDKAIVVKDYDPIYISGKDMHQNACAPGYQMYFTWMIPHLVNNPWNKRQYDKKHEWINESNLKIKDTKEIH